MYLRPALSVFSALKSKMTPPPTNNQHSVKTGKGKKSESTPMFLQRIHSHSLNSEKATCGQRGPKGYFQGSRREFLESNLPAYMAVKKGSRLSFWHKFWSAWWARYPWKLGDSAEPPTDAEEMKKLASVGHGEDNLKEGVETRLKIVRQILLFFSVDLC